MNKIPLSHLDLDLYQEKLDNGLEIYVIPKQNVNNAYVTFSTKYGSVDNDFIPINEKEMYTVPPGVAHFLEHKVFEQKSGESPLSFFTKQGAECNAYTSYFKTTYLFSGCDNFEENLNYLIDFVQEPYFTDENVEKEKGIIIQEIGMYEDDPYRKAFEKIMYNTFNDDPIKYNVIGTKESVSSITKDDLYKCYHTFYHPSNMFVVVTGNVDPIKTIEIIKENQSKKEYTSKSEIVKKEIDEKKEVFKKEEKIKMNTTIPKVVMSYKFKLKKYNIENQKFRRYLDIFFNIKFGNISKFLDTLKEQKIISDGIGNTLLETDDYEVLLIDTETFKPNEFINKLDEEIKIKEIDENDFNRKKKRILSSCIYMSDDIYSMNNKIMSDIIDDGFVKTNVYEDIKKLNYQEFKTLIDSLDFSYKSTLIIEPKETNE